MIFHEIDRRERADRHKKDVVFDDIDRRKSVGGHQKDVI